MSCHPPLDATDGSWPRATLLAIFAASFALGFGCCPDRPIPTTRPPQPLLEHVTSTKSPDPPEAKNLQVPRTIVVNRDPGPGEAMRLRVVVGSLPKGAELVVLSKDGEIVGTITEYGRRGREKRATHTLPLPARLVKDRTMALRFEIHDSEKSSTRAVSDEELLEVEAVIIEVTSTEGND